MARGGRRAGAAGKGYGTNRSDLNAQRTLPVTPVKGGEYGSGAASVAAQQAVPIATQPTPAPLTGIPAPAQPYAGPQPGQFGDPLRPTDLPDQHPMTGAPTGPGPGMEALALPLPPPSPLQQGLAALNQLGDGASPLLKAIRSQAAIGQ